MFVVAIYLYSGHFLNVVLFSVAGDAMVRALVPIAYITDGTLVISKKGGGKLNWWVNRRRKTGLVFVCVFVSVCKIKYKTHTHRHVHTHIPIH